MARPKKAAKPKTERKPRTPKSGNDEALKLDLIRIFSYCEKTQTMIDRAHAAYLYIKGLDVPHPPSGPDISENIQSMPAELIVEAPVAHKLSKFEEINM